MNDSSPIPKDTGKNGKHDVDLFRDTPVRLFGYANELGEAFRPIFPRLLIPSYVAAFAYVGADSAAKTLAAMKKGENKTAVVTAGVDTLLWQTLASVLIPGKIINLITMKAVTYASSSKPYIMSIPKPLLVWGPTLLGLSAIPIIVQPIDSAVDALMNMTIRRWYS